MEASSRTAYGDLLVTAKLQNTKWVCLPNSTLNEKFDVQKGIYPRPNELPSLRYFSIGVGAHMFTMGANNMPLINILQHKPTDAVLFKHIPFVMRELSNDLDVTARGNYAMRRIEVHNNVQYVCYYLKRLKLDDVVPQLIYKTVDPTGATKATPWLPDADVLNPIPSPLADTGVNVTSGDYITATAVNDISFDINDINELNNVGNILFGDPRYLIISEIGLVSAVDHPIQVSGPGSSTFNFMEAIAAQITNHLGTAYIVSAVNQGFDLAFDLGATEPIFLLQQAQA